MKTLVFLLFVALCAHGQFLPCNSSEVQSSCFECTKNPECGFCRPRTGASGCYYKVGNNMPPDGVCDNPDNREGDMWYSFAGDCPDPCHSHDLGKCGACTETRGCGYCNNGGGCRTGTAEGPWTDQLIGCEDWRYKSNPSWKEVEICSQFAPCSTAKDCDVCHSTYERIGSGCRWCAESASTFEGECVSLNETCSIGVEQPVCPERAAASSIPYVATLSVTILFALAIL